jgi:hypothetical protein
LAFKRNLERAINALINQELGGRTDLCSAELAPKLKRKVHLNGDSKETGHPGQHPEGEVDETGQDQEKKSP